MVTKVINVEVREDGDVKELEKDLKKIEFQSKSLESQSKKTSKTLQDGIEGAESAAGNLSGGLGGIVKQYQTISKAAKISGKAMKSALISTGVGALIVALGVIVDNWESIYNWITGANEELEKQKRLNEEINRELERREYLQNLDLKLQQRQEQLDVLRARIAGKSESEITAIKRKGFEDRLAIAQREADEANKILSSSVKADQKTYEEAVKAQEDAYNRLSAARFELEIFNLESQLPSGKKGNEIQKRDDTSSVKGVLSNTQLAELENAQIVADGQVSILAKRISKEKALEATRLEFKKEIMAQEAGIVAQAANLLTQIDEDNKAFAVAGIITEKIASAAQIISSTAQANAKAVAASPLTGGQPWVTINSISAGLGIASSAVAAAKAISQLGGSGGSGGSPSLNGLGGGGASAPSFNVVGTSGVNQLAESLQQNQQPIEAYVVANNVTTAQSLNNNIVETASIG